MLEVEKLILNAFLNSEKSLREVAISVFAENDFASEEAKECFKRFKAKIEEGLIPSAMDCSGLERKPFVFEDEKHIRGMRKLLLTEKVKILYENLRELVKNTEDFELVSQAIESLAEEIVQLKAEVKSEERVCEGERWEEVAEEILQRTEMVEFQPNEFTTGIGELDNKISLNRGHLLVVGARPGVGKTTFALNVAVENALRGKRVLFFSMEMPIIQIAERVLAIGTGIKLENIQMGRLTEEEKKKVREFVKLIKENLIIVEGDKSVAEIRFLTKREKPDMVVVDYIQRMKGEKGQTEYERISKAVSGLKSIALEENVFVVALAQINRESSKRADKKPTLSDLKGSGKIEEDADTVLLLHSPAQVWREKGKDVPDDLKNVLHIIVAKNRHKGFIGIIVVERDESGRIRKRVIEEEITIDEDSNMSPEEIIRKFGDNEEIAKEWDIDLDF